MTTHPLDGPYETLPVARLRKLYAGVRERAMARITREDFDKQVHQFLRKHGTPAGKATPADWVKAAVRVRHDCSKCHCSGTYVWGANRQFSGVCYRCEGKGWQHDADRRRNWGYDHMDRRRDQVDDDNRYAHEDALRDGDYDDGYGHWQEVG